MTNQKISKGLDGVARKNQKVPSEEEFAGVLNYCTQFLQKANIACVEEYPLGSKLDLMWWEFGVGEMQNTSFVPEGVKGNTMASTSKLT